MLTSIQYKDSRLLLAVRNKPNIFDIDSLSLIIGPNGAGKTEFLKATIEKFNPRSRTQLQDCRLLFNEREYFSSKSLSEWGVIYYSPTPNGPMLAKYTRFVDASKSRGRNFFELVDHEDILVDFNISVALTARIELDVKRIGVTLAEALISNKVLRGGSTDFDYEEAENFQRKLKGLSDFASDEAAYLHAEKRHKSSIARLASILVEDLRRDAHTYLTALTVAQHLFKIKGFDIQAICWAIVQISGLNAFNHNLSIRVPTRRKIEDIISRVDNTFQRFPFEETPDYPLTYSYTLDVDADRDWFERAEIRQIFNVAPPGMSSGQQAILRQIIGIHEAMEKLSKRKKLLILLDEGDAFLHLQWQRQYIQKINQFLKKTKARFGYLNVQVIIASHSPLLTSDVPNEFICRLDERGLPLPAAPSFAAPLQKILNLGFDSSTIGELATRRINETIDNIQKGTLTEQDDYIIEAIEDPIIKRELIYMKEQNS